VWGFELPCTCRLIPLSEQGPASWEGDLRSVQPRSRYPNALGMQGARGRQRRPPRHESPPPRAAPPPSDGSEPEESPQRILLHATGSKMGSHDHASVLCEKASDLVRQLADHARDAGDAGHYQHGSDGRQSQQHRGQLAGPLLDLAVDRLRLESTSSANQALWAVVRAAAAALGSARAALAGAALDVTAAEVRESTLAWLCIPPCRFVFGSNPVTILKARTDAASWLHKSIQFVCVHCRQQQRPSMRGLQPRKRGRAAGPRAGDRRSTRSCLICSRQPKSARGWQRQRQPRQERRLRLACDTLNESSRRLRLLQRVLWHLDRRPRS
jgi:hypothetical protein